MEKINSPAINSKDYMISFDVVSLFTKVPIKEVILILKIILEQDDSLEDRTAITPGELCNLVELCVVLKRHFMNKKKEHQWGLLYHQFC